MSVSASWEVIEGDNMAALTAMANESVDAVVTDPPAGIGFMGKAWDKDKGGREQWVAWLAGVMRECLRVLKPGGHALVWALPRTSHWTATAIENAGFEIRDVVHHHFGNGFPKSLNVSKAIDAAAGAVREVVGGNPNHRAVSGVEYDGVYAGGNTGAAKLTAPATDAAKEWDGYGTALKPATEHWVLARKPLAGTVAVNVLAHGTGALNIDGCRVGENPGYRYDAGANGTTFHGEHGAREVQTAEARGAEVVESTKGRWPANLALSHSPDCTVVGEHVYAGDNRTGRGRRGSGFADVGAPSGDAEPNGTLHGDAVAPVFDCAPGCPVALLDEQSGILTSGEKRETVRANREGFSGPMPAIAKATKPSKGGASRFFATFHYIAKPSRAERDAGLDDLPALSGGEATERVDGSAGLKNPRAGAGRGGGAKNPHPTVKSIALMSWLCRLVTPPGGVVLDPFCGSGTTGCAAVIEGFRFVGCEMSPEFVEVARARITHWAPAPVEEPRQYDLFANGGG